MGYDLINGNWRRCDNSSFRALCSKCGRDEATEGSLCHRCWDMGSCDRCAQADCVEGEDYCAKCLNILALEIIDTPPTIVPLPRIAARPIDPIALDQAAHKLAKAIVALVRSELSEESNQKEVLNG